MVTWSRKLSGLGSFTWTGAWTHWPVATSQESRVQAFPSSQLIGMLRHAPVEGSQRSAVHGFPSSQVTGVPAHTTGPPTIWRQTSFAVHRSPSLHGCPTRGVKTQPPALASQESRVQTFPSSHTRGEFTHCPVFGSHRSTVQGLPSLQASAVPRQVALRPSGSGTHRSPARHGAASAHRAA